MRSTAEEATEEQQQQQRHLVTSFAGAPHGHGDGIKCVVHSVAWTLLGDFSTLTSRL